MPGTRNPSEEEARLFAEIYMFEAGMNASKAANLLYEREGKNTNGRVWCQIGYQFLHHPKVQANIKQIENENREMFEINRRKIINKLNEMVDADNTTDKTKLDAMDKLIRMIGGYNDSLEMKGTQTLEVVIE